MRLNSVTVLEVVKDFVDQSWPLCGNRFLNELDKDAFFDISKRGQENLVRLRLLPVNERSTTNFVQAGVLSFGVDVRSSTRLNFDTEAVFHDTLASIVSRIILHSRIDA